MTIPPPPERARATLADVAREAGVDSSTVSRVLRGRAPRIPEATRDRVMAAAERLQYVPNANARSLVSSTTRSLGLLIPSMSSAVMGDVIRGATAAAREAGYFMMVIDGSEVGSAAEALRHTVMEGRVDGLLVASGTDEDSIDESLLARLPQCVVLNRRIAASTTSITLDDALGMEKLVRQMVSLGHREIGCIAGPAGVDTATRRREGYLRGMAGAGLPIRDDWVISATYDEAGGYTAALEMLREGERPTAIVAASTVSAVGILAACADLGIRVPDDLSVNSFHDATLANYLVPRLSTVRMPLYELGRAGARLLIQQINGETVPQSVVISEPGPELLPRASIAPPRA